MHERISKNFYISDFSKHLKAYLWHFQQCRMNRTPRHRSFGALQPILTPPFLFHTISVDFILDLPKIPLEGWNVILTVTEKLYKSVTMIPGKSTWSTQKWGTALISRLLLILWGLPRAIISDRDSKFTSDIWQGIFSALDVTMLFSTAYHPQTDGVSERTNQQIEIAMRYMCACLEDTSK